MATVTEFIDTKPTMQRLGGELVLAKNELNFADTPASAADVIQALKIPAGSMVLSVLTYINTAEGDVATCDVGDATDPNGYNDACDLNAAAGTVEKALEADALSVGKYYAADDTIDLTLDHNLDAAIVTVMALYAPIEKVS